MAPREWARYWLRNALNLDGRAIAEPFGDTWHHLGGVIAHANDGVGAVFCGMRREQLKGILARLPGKGS
jgi:hypothetical protein